MTPLIRRSLTRGLVAGAAIRREYVYMNRGLIERSGNLAELAGVVGHEIGHVEARHGADPLERMQVAPRVQRLPPPQEEFQPEETGG